ncbi:MAG: hypothetical protein AAF441_20265 [Pseudomonadota bacterium]
MYYLRLTWQLVIVLAVLAAASPLMSAGVAFAQGTAGSSSEVREALEKLKRSNRYEFELPNQNAAELDPSLAPRGPDTPGNRFDRHPPDKPTLLPTSIPSELRLLFWVLIFAALGYVLLPLISEFVFKARAHNTGFGDAEAGHPSEAGDAEALWGPEASFDQAQKFASTGNYAGAVHSLWMCTVKDIAASRNAAAVSPANTGRDIVDALKERALLMSAVGTLVRKVEISRFGGRDLDGTDYSESLEAFERAREIITAGRAT